MKRIAVAGFAAVDRGGPALDPDAVAAAEYVTGELRALLRRSGALDVVDAAEVEPVAAALAEAARTSGAQLAVGGVLRLGPQDLRVSALLTDAQGEVRGTWDEALPAETASALPQLLARAVLLAAGERASAPPEPAPTPAPRDAFLQLVRARPLSEAPDCARLLRLVEELPGFEAPRRALLAAADAARGTERMPALLAALEQLRELRPGDAEALLALGEYRALHLDLDGARAAWSAARDAAAGPEHAVRAIEGLVRLAVHQGRPDQAVAHLRTAITLTDDPEHHRLLGELLLPQDPAAAAHSLARATVLAPGDAQLHLQLAHALHKAGDPDRAAAEAAEAARLDPSLFDEVSTLLAELLG